MMLGEKVLLEMTYMNMEEMKWAQKARNKGIVLGDRNTKYF